MRALAGVAVAGFVLGLAALELVVTGTHETVNGPFIALALTLGWSFIGTGVYATWRRPDQPIGRLMTLVGFLWFAGALPESDSVPLYTIGLVVSGFWLGPFIHLLIAFPSGQVAPGLERWVVRVGYLLPLGQPLAVLFTAEPYQDCHGCPDNVLLIADAPAAIDAGNVVFGLVAVAMLVGVAVVLTRRWRRSGPVARRALAPVLLTGAAVAAVGVTSVIPSVAGHDEITEVFDTALITLITAVPFAFLAGLLRSSVSRAGALGALMERVGTTNVRDALAEALGDPDLEIAFWLPDRGEYVDAAGPRQPWSAPTEETPADTNGHG
jgi:hypothetical protein